MINQEYGQILEKLGRVQEGVERLREDLRTEQEHAHESRSAVHGRLDDVGVRLGQVESAIAVDGQISAQVRAEVAALRENFNKSKETIDEFRRMKAVGVGIVGLVGLGGTAFGASLFWWGDAVKAAITHWLGFK